MAGCTILEIRNGLQTPYTRLEGAEHKRQQLHHRALPDFERSNQESSDLREASCNTVVDSGMIDPL